MGSKLKTCASLHLSRSPLEAGNLSYFISRESSQDCIIMDVVVFAFMCPGPIKHHELYRSYVCIRFPVDSNGDSDAETYHEKPKFRSDGGKRRKILSSLSITHMATAVSSTLE